MQYTIRQANYDDIPAMMKIYDAGRSYMRNEGNASQWEGYPTEDIASNDIQKKTAYMIEDSGKPVACFTFIIGPDPTYSYIEGGEWTDNEKPYGTIHRIASLQNVHGILAASLDFCFSMINNIRIDTHKDNKTMLHLLEKHGFEKCGIIYVADGTPRCAFQKILV